jgi:hypothetical protein
MITDGTSRSSNCANRKEFTFQSRIMLMQRRSSSFASHSRKRKSTICRSSCTSKLPRKRLLWSKNNKIKCRLSCEEFNETERNKLSIDKLIQIDWFRGTKTYWMIFWKSKVLKREEPKTFWSTRWESEKKNQMMRLWLKWKLMVMILSQTP